MMFGTPLAWRETHRQPRFLMFDGRIVVLVFLTIMHIRIWTLFLLVTTIVTLFWFDRKNIPAESILRWLRATIVGKKRSARGHAEYRSSVDFGFERKADIARIEQQIASRQRDHEKKKASGLAGKAAGTARKGAR